VNFFLHSSKNWFNVSIHILIAGLRYWVVWLLSPRSKYPCTTK